MQSVCSSVCFGLFNGFERIGDKIVRLFYYSILQALSDTLHHIQVLYVDTSDPFY